MFSRCKPTQHYYKTCQLCGSNLDPGEKCDCEERGEKVESKNPVNHVSVNALCTGLRARLQTIH